MSFSIRSSHKAPIKQDPQLSPVKSNDKPNRKKQQPYEVDWSKVDDGESSHSSDEDDDDNYHINNADEDIPSPNVPIPKIGSSTKKTAQPNEQAQPDAE